MADTIYYGTTPDREGKDRYFNTIVELPSAREFGPGLGIIGEPAALKVSNGIEWSQVSVLRVPTFADLPPASEFGVGVAQAQDTGDLYKCNAISYSEIVGVSDLISNTVTSDSLGFLPGTDITAGLNAALATLGAEKSIQFAPGVFTISDTITISNNGVTLKGAGRYATRFLFSPAADKECFKFSKGASVLFNCGITDCTINSQNTTLSKTAIALYDTSEFLCRDVMILAFKGKDSTGIRTYGREDNTLENLRVTADICLRLSPNVNTLEWLSVDHMVLRDTYFTASAAATAGGTIPTTNILIDDKSMISGFTMEGRNAWVSGQRGLYNLDTTSTMASYMFEIANVRREQPTDANYAAIHIERNTTAGKLQSVRIKNFYNGVDQKGFYLRGIDNLLLDNTLISATASEALDIDNVTSMEWINARFDSANPTHYVMPNMELVSGRQTLTGKLYPLTASFQKKPAAVYQQKPITGMNNAKKWEYSGDLADAAQIQIPINTTNGYVHGIIDVVATADDGTEFEAGTFALSVGANAGGSSTKGIMKISGSAKTYSTNTAGGFMVYCNSATTNLLNNVYIYNRLGKAIKVVARATFF